MKKGAALGNGTLRAFSVLRVAESAPSAALAKGHSNSQEARSSGASRIYLSTCINLSPALKCSLRPPPIEPTQGGDPSAGRRPHIVPTSAFLSKSPLPVILRADHFSSARTTARLWATLGCRVRSAVCYVRHFSTSADGGTGDMWRHN